MNVEKTPFDELIVIKSKCFEDNRGWFLESYNTQEFLNNKLLYKFVQDNHAYNKSENTFRGFHLQSFPFQQTKLIRCIRGSILDIVIDLRKGSKTFGKSYSITLSSRNRLQLLIPKGFAHGYITLENDVEIEYKVDNYYNKDSELTISYKDPLLDIDLRTEDLIISDKDRKAKFLKSLDEIAQ
jgi:dTDP-4-dehydrorhamnose 3,5-epimerase